jgi:two-component system chemotaxis response regulator CheB
VLTGIGHDGSEGAAEIARAGGWVVAQDEATSLAYRMPRAVALKAPSAEVVPLDRCAEAAVRAVRSRRVMGLSA